MTALSEAAKVEMMKLAVQLTQQYVSSKDKLGHTELSFIGLKGAPAGVSLLDAIDHIYDHLSGRITR